MTNDQRDKCITDSHDILMRIEPMVLTHEKELRGNGNAGLLEKVTIMQTAQKTCLATQAGKTPRIANWVAVAALIVAIFAVFMGSK
jgi:hypothetical protein